jgi:hypothetical protein
LTVATSLTALYGRLTQPQYKLLARIRNGEDVRAYSDGVHHSTLYRLLERRVLACAATTCKLTLIPPANAVRAAEGI